MSFFTMYLKYRESFYSTRRLNQRFSLLEWSSLHYIFTRYGAASGLQTNRSNSTLYFSCGDSLEIAYIAGIFGVVTAPLKDGIYYLGYKLKPNNYKTVDWLWLVDKYKKKLYKWTHRYLSLEGRYILAAFQQIYVFWAHLGPC